MGKKVIVYHGSYGCESGCCGHWIKIGDKEEIFSFDHPYNQDEKEFAKRIIAEELGAEHVADLDWEHCQISDD